MTRRSSVGAMFLVLSSLVLLLTTSTPVHAGSASSGARALFFDPSLRSSSLGGAGASLWWGGDPNDWANPALLPLHRGIRYADMQADLIPQLSTDTRFTSRRLTLAWEEFGLVDGGKIGLADGGRFDMGSQTAVDESGVPLGDWQPWAETRSLGIGVDLVGLTHRLGWRVLAPDRWILSVGHTWKTYEDQLAPDRFLQDSGGGGTTADTRDFGVFARWTPRNSLGGTDRWLPGLGGARLDLALGWSRLNYNGARVSYVDTDQADPIAKVGRLSGAVTFAAGHLNRQRDGSWLDLLSRGLSPLVTVAVIYDRRDFTTPGNADGTRDWHDWGHEERETGYGVELIVANVFSYRLGHVDDDTGGITGQTSGWSLGLQLGAIAGFRYDEATVPQSAGLDDVTRTGWTAYVDVVELVQAVQEPEGENHGKN